MRAIEELFSAAGCQGWLCVRDVDGGGDAAVALRAGEPVASASVFKVTVGLEVALRIEAGDLDPAARVRLVAGETTAGPTGFSRFEHDAEASVADLLRAMMAISDNAATDALLDLVGVDAVNATTRALGLVGTMLPGPLRDLVARVSETGTGTEAYADAHALSPEGGPRTTAADMAELLCLIWRDEAGPPAACARLREAMAGQFTRHRLRAAFPREVGVVAKSGTLAGILRNEVGVITRPDGRRFAAAVFTRAAVPGRGDREIDAAIGAAAAAAVARLVGASGAGRP